VLNCCTKCKKEPRWVQKKIKVILKRNSTLYVDRIIYLFVIKQ
jgi:hypothetical protein